MTITKDHIGGLVFLCLSVAYGYYARDIPLLPGDEFEPFTARSVPNALAWIGGVLSLALIVTAKSDTANTLRLAGLDFGLVSKLLILVVLFGLALDWLGFLLATVLFLIAGYWLLGERRPKMLLVASVPFAVGIWFVLTQLLDIYLAKGKFFTMLMGG
ncbi:tripartite tricarboxylate transporter TctB family protein [Aliamphritea spongicola]|uniref:tripartite tricarboxylate transporter TctB family protein n=1 Tax=Aliamphritea spongicola TaxID=707589 RepID=UPI00196B5232|nr:tripartite tricarboxylate transporter TctB family protein [Aliamphritea spongicola]MBN3563718.1 tripartite tricarboxylate transporter TctB family protein [Aliamphritea spongicola]